MHIILNGKVIGTVRSRPIIQSAIVRYAGINYTVLRVKIEEIHVEKRLGGFGQVATPDYNFDEQPAIEPGHRFRIIRNEIVGADIYLGTITLDKMPTTDLGIRIDGKPYRVVNWSVGQRKIDELYVEEA